MALMFMTRDPAELLKQFNLRIAQHELKGKITTWSKDGQGDYTHKADQWKNKAWFRPQIETGRLTFNIIRPKGAKVTALVYAYYHGHLTETFLNHFDKLFEHASSTALYTVGDLC